MIAVKSIAAQPDSTMSDEVAIQILQYMSISDLSQTSLVCREWKRLSEDNLLWKEKFIEYFGLEKGKIYETKTSYKNIIRQVFILNKKPTTDYYDLFKVAQSTNLDEYLENKNGETLLTLAIKQKLWIYVEILLTIGADPNKANKNGQLPLHLLLKSRYFDLVEFFLEYGLN